MTVISLFEKVSFNIILRNGDKRIILRRLSDVGKFETGTQGILRNASTVIVSALIPAYANCNTQALRIQCGYFSFNFEEEERKKKENGHQKFLAN